MQIARLPDIDEGTWAEVKAYVESNPETAKALQGFAKNPEAMRGCRANPYAVDSSGNSGLHYAAGYGRKELLEYLLKVGANVSQANSQGQTPMAVATQNQQEACIQILKAHGAQA
eukprot:g31265.t1